MCFNELLEQFYHYSWLVFNAFCGVLSCIHPYIHPDGCIIYIYIYTHTDGCVCTLCLYVYLYLGEPVASCR